MVRRIRITAAGRRFQASAPKNKTIPPVRPNAGIEAAYRKRLDALVTEMAKSAAYWISAAYRANEPEMAQDASPARELIAVMKRLGRKWERRFDEAAPELAAYFATAASERSDAALRAILKRAGFAVDFNMTRAANDAYQAVVGENVSLIKSIPSEYFTEVEGLVLRSVQIGRDIGGLTQDLQARYEITKRRAALIARDQNNKATAVINRVRQKELGVTKAVWMHSGGGKKPRPGHVAYSGKEYDIEKGAYIDGAWILPGELINCRCVSRSVIPGFAH